MKTLFLYISLFFFSPIFCSTLKSNHALDQLQLDSTTSFDAKALVKTLEDYTLFTRTEPQNTSEELVINQLITDLSTQNCHLESAIKHNKALYHGTTPKNIETKLRQYSDSVRVALKELHKRQQRVRILAQNLTQHEHEITHIALREQDPMNLSVFSASQRLKDSFLQSPLVSSC